MTEMNTKDKRGRLRKVVLLKKKEKKEKHKQVVLRNSMSFGVRDRHKEK